MERNRVEGWKMEFKKQITSHFLALHPLVGEGWVGVHTTNQIYAHRTRT